MRADDHRRSRLFNKRVADALLGKLKFHEQKIRLELLRR